MKNTSQIYIGIREDGEIVENNYGEIHELCAITQLLLSAIYKVLYYSNDDETDIEASKRTISTMQKIYVDALKSATKDIANGDGNENIFYEGDV